MKQTTEEIEPIIKLLEEIKSKFCDFKNKPSVMKTMRGGASFAINKVLINKIKLPYDSNILFILS